MADQDISLPRRSVLASTATALAGTAFPGTGGADSRPNGVGLSTGAETVPPLEFYFPNGLLNPDGEPLRDESTVAVWAEPEAEFTDAKAYYEAGAPSQGYYETDGTVVEYPDGERIPLVAVDEGGIDEGTVVGVGALMTPDGTTWSRGNAQFMLNLWDRTIRRDEPTETVLFHEFDSVPGDDSRQMYWQLERFDRFRQYAEANGYELITDSGPVDPNFRKAGNPAGSAFVATLEAENPSAVWLPVPERLNEAELVALEEYIDRGGTVFLHDSSDILAEEWDLSNGRTEPYYDDGNGNSAAEGSPDPSSNLNEIAERLDADFRFNDGVVRDPEHGAGRGRGFDRIPVTTQFNTEAFADLFADRDGIEPNDVFYHYVGKASSVDDGDTYNILFDTSGNTDQGFEVRVLGIDTPEDGPSVFERPVEWEGVAEDLDSVPLIKTLQFDNACSLVAPDGSRLTDERVVAVHAEDTATNREVDGEAQFVDYGEDPIPLVADCDGVLGVGSLYVDDCADLSRRQDGVPDIEFLQNVWDAHLGGGATVLYDEGHGQPKTLEDHSEFADASQQQSSDQTRDKANYTIKATTDIAADLSEADAIWITPPERPFDDEELERLSAFVANGGSVFLHGRGNVTGSAFTANLNEVADAVEAPFRFNGDTVTDSTNNGGPEEDTNTTASCASLDAEEKPQTGNFGDRNRFPFFLLRQGKGGGDGTAYNHPYLQSWAGPSTEFTREYLKGATGAEDLVQQFPQQPELVFELDPQAVTIGGLGRIYGNTYRAEDYPDGKSLAERLLAAGLARAYDTGHSQHDDYLALELEARANDVGIWTESDPARSEQVRNRPVDRVHFPQAASVRTSDGALALDRAPILAEPTAKQEGDPGIRYEATPLVGIDRDSRVAIVGSPLLAENYEMRENDYRDESFVDIDPFWVNTAGYENFVFLANLLRDLSETENGSVLFDCGHEQFGGSVDRFGGNYTVSPEDARYFERFLEGIGIDCEAIEDITANLVGGELVAAQALVVSTPTIPFTDAELETLREFRDRGGAIVFLGSAEAPQAEKRLLNRTAAALGTDLRLNDDQVLDDEHNLNGLARLPTSGNKNEAFAGSGLFEAADTVSWTGPGDGLPADDDDDGEGGDDGGGDDGGDDGEQKPEMSASGSRSDDGSVFTQGQTNQIDVTITSFADPVDEVAITDSVPEGWRVQPYGDAKNSGDIRTVKLGTVSRQELKQANNGVTRTYFVEATGSTGRDTFGPATATATNGEPVEPDSAAFAGTDTNTVVGASQGGGDAAGSGR